MLHTPIDHPFQWKQPPRLVIGLALTIILIFIFWHPADKQRIAAMNTLYTHELMRIEWPLYETHLLKAGRRQTLVQLKKAYDEGDFAVIAHSLGTDAQFAQQLEANGKEYLTDEDFSRWHDARTKFDDEQRKLSTEALGVDPQRFRPITFLTHTLINDNAILFAGSLFFLLTAGMALELALGTGAVLAGFLGSGILGAFTYLIFTKGGVLPYTGSGAGIAGLLGMYAMHFRTQRVNWFGRLPLTAVVLPILWVFFVGMQFFNDHRFSTFLPQIIGFLAGPLWYLAYRRWFAANQEEQTVIVTAETDDDLVYREQLQKALDAVGQMDFISAQKKLRDLVKQYPNDLRVITQLYQLEKLTPDSTTFDAVARRLFQLGTHSEDGAKTTLSVYRDYDKASLDKRALDIETSLKLVMRFSRMGEVKDADKLMKTLLSKNITHTLLPKVALTLSKAFEQLHDPARAEYYKEIAGRPSGS